MLEFFWLGSVKKLLHSSLDLYHLYSVASFRTVFLLDESPIATMTYLHGVSQIGPLRRSGIAFTCVCFTVHRERVMCLIIFVPYQDEIRPDVATYLFASYISYLSHA